MSAPGTEQDDVSVVAAPYGLELYRQTLALREAILREPLGLTLTEEGLADGALRQNFCAISHSAVVGSASLKPLDRKTLQLQQMAVAEDRRQEQIGMQLLACAEDWARGENYRVIIFNARLGAEGFYGRFGYIASGDSFDENTIPHIRMTKVLARQRSENER